MTRSSFSIENGFKMAHWWLLPFYGKWLAYFPLPLDKPYDIFLAAQKGTQPVETVDPQNRHSLRIINLS